MKALFMLMACIWRKYPGSIIMGEFRASEKRMGFRYEPFKGCDNHCLTLR